MILKTFEQEKWHEQHEVAINSNMVVTVDGSPTANPREIALGHIVLRLNAGRTLLHDENLLLKEQIAKLKAKNEEQKKEIESLSVRLAYREDPLRSRIMGHEPQANQNIVT